MDGEVLSFATLLQKQKLFVYGQFHDHFGGLSSETLILYRFLLASVILDSLRVLSTGFIFLKLPEPDHPSDHS